MKIGIVTFQKYNNYGAVLQCYGLQYVLKKLGHIPEFVDYKCDYIEKPYRLVNLKKKGIFNYIYGVIGYICYLPRKKKFSKFREKMTYSKRMTREEIQKVSLDYDAYITGSDQVWNHKLTNGDTTYFLDFDKEKKKYSYAASMGEVDLSTTDKESHKKLLSDFSGILVRETMCAEYVNDILGLQAETVLDPTLLLDKEDWEAVCSTKKAKGDYILVYQLGISPRVVNYVRKLKKETGLRVEYVPFPLGSFLSAKCNVAAGPQEWLSLIKNAKYVVTDSFHGIAFSVIFNKQFWVEVSGHHRNRRAEDFLKLLGLEDRSIESALCENEQKTIDYARVNVVLKQQQEKSITLLKNMLTNA